jgi:hypothetical protein
MGVPHAWCDQVATHSVYHPHPAAANSSGAPYPFHVSVQRMPDPPHGSPVPVWANGRLCHGRYSPHSRFPWCGYDSGASHAVSQRLIDSLGHRTQLRRQFDLWVGVEGLHIVKPVLMVAYLEVRELQTVGG